MQEIKVLDCTLRDGGYCNDCNFGNDNIKKIINSLIEANIDIVECGFLTDKVSYDLQKSRFTSMEELAAVLPEKRDGKFFVALMNYGDYDLEKLPQFDGSSISGIRVAFHKKDRISALETCRKIKEKGYQVFIQAMVSLSYSDEEFLDLIRRVNELQPYAFYIVDSFGMMKRKELTRLFYMVEHNLTAEIKIGFHSHNNMQLAYSNAQSLVDIHTDRTLIIDSSVFGMGRGAGNLNTELFVQYLNENTSEKYTLKPLLKIIDEILSGIYQENYWGYSLPNYLSAKHCAHPNYASYLDAKKTLTVENMDDIFSMMDVSKKFNYDKAYIEDLYLKYMATGHVQETRLSELGKKLANRDIVIIAPGKSSSEEKNKIIDFISRNDVVTISVNFDYPEYDTDLIFLSNLRRYKELPAEKRERCIVTSNIPAVDVYLQTKYIDLLNEEDFVRDNSALMLIKYLMCLGAKKVYLAGIDGYSVDPSQNFADQKMVFYTRKAVFNAMNVGMNKVLKEYSTKLQLEFLTTPKYVNI